MCGLVGMAGTLEYKHKQVMKDLLFLNSLRGRDSTGLTAIKRDRTVLTRKMTVPGYEFIEHPSVEKAMSFNDQLWIGHGRFKTTGEITRANAHPFEVLDEDGDVFLVGAHNGTLVNKYEIQNKLKGDKFDTDSETLFNWLAEAPNYKEAIAKLRGAWSLVWWDPTVDSVHFCRNDERPLTYAYTKDRKAVVWASEAWMIINACSRNGLELEKSDRGFSCYATLPDHLYTLPIPQRIGEELPDLKREGGYTGESGTPFQTGFDYKRGNSWWDNPKKDEKKTPQREKEATSTSSPKSVIDLGNTQGKVRGYGGVLISIEDLDNIKAKGCGWCNNEIPDGTIFSFLSEDSLCCVRCMRDTHPKTKENTNQDTDPLDDDLPDSLKDKSSRLSLIESVMKKVN